MFLNPFVPWDKRYKEILGGQLTHLGQPRMVVAFSVHRLMSLGIMINASGQMVINGNIPFSEVIAAWYQANTYEWERLLVDSGKFQLVRSCQEPKEIATASTVLRVSKAMLNEIDIEDNIPFYDQFVKDIEKLEKANAVLNPGSELRNSIVTFISENYTPREAGHLICPACLLRLRTFCLYASDAMVHWLAGERSQLNKMRAPPQACQNVNAKKAEMAMMTTTMTSRWRMRIKTKLTDWSGSPREQPEMNLMMTLTCRTRSRADHRPDLEAGESALPQTLRWHSAATPRNSRKKRTKESLKNKNMTKSRGKPESNCHYGHQERFRHLSSTVSTLLRTRMQSTALQERSTG